jgi:(p)ppGpp synthase/HD superfamily hydrolase
MFDRMMSLAVKGHMGQTDRGGTPYILHPVSIMMALKTKDLELMQIALGHDLVEDTAVTLDELVRTGFSNRVVSAIDCLTRRHEELWLDYIKRVSTNSDAVTIKLLDLRENQKLDRLGVITDRDLVLQASYSRAHSYLLCGKYRGYEGLNYDG